MRFLRRALAIAIFLLALSGAASATTITISSTTIGGWRYAATAPQLRIYLNKAITTSDGKILQPGSTQTSNSFYQTVTCSVAANVLTIPQFTLDSTTDALVGNDATYSGYFYVSGATGAAQIGPYQGFTKFALSPLPVSTTWSLILQFNNTFIPHRDPFTYSREQIDFKLQQASGVPLSRVITTTSPLTGGGGLSGDLTIALPKATSLVNGYLAATDFTIFNAKQAGPLTGDVTTSGAAVTLASVITAGSCTICNLTYDAKGRVTNATNGTAGFTDPLTTQGDLIFRNATQTTRLAKGAANTVLQSNGTTILYGAVPDAALSANIPLLNAASNSFTGMGGFGTGTFTAYIYDPVQATPTALRLLEGSDGTPSTSSAPTLSLGAVKNAPYIGGIGVATIIGTSVGHSMEVVSITATQTTAITDGGGLAGLYLRVVGSQAGAGQSNFAIATNVQRNFRVDSTEYEANPSNTYSRAVSGATNASPIVITTTAAHDMNSGDTALIASVGGNTAANGSFVITKLSATTFSIPVAGNGAYTSGGTVGLHAASSYSTGAGNRVTGLAIFSSGNAPATAGIVIGNTVGVAPYYTPIDIQQGALYTGTNRALRIPNAGRIESLVAAGGNQFSLIQGSAADKVWLDADGKTILAGTSLTRITNATGTLNAAAIAGTTTNDDAAASILGEYVSASVPVNTLALTANTSKTVTSISLAPGDWDVGGMVLFRNPGSGIEIAISISRTDNTFDSTVGYYTDNAATAWAGDTSQALPRVRIQVPAGPNVPVYLVALCGASINAGGFISARRPR